MKNLFVPYEIALIAKEKGFNEPCLAEYDLLDKQLELIDSLEFPSKNLKNNLCAPLYQQIIDWLVNECGRELVYDPTDKKDYLNTTLLKEINNIHENYLPK